MLRPASMKSEGSARIDAPFAVVCMLIFSTLLLAHNCLYQLAQIAVRYIANFGLVINGHQRNGNIILRLLHIIGDDSSTTAFTLALQSNGHTMLVSIVAQQGGFARVRRERRCSRQQTSGISWPMLWLDARTPADNRK